MLLDATEFHNRVQQMCLAVNKAETFLRFKEEISNIALNGIDCTFVRLYHLFRTFQPHVLLLLNNFTAEPYHFELLSGTQDDPNSTLVVGLPKILEEHLRTCPRDHSCEPPPEPLDPAEDINNLFVRLLTSCVSKETADTFAKLVLYFSDNKIETLEFLIYSTRLLYRTPEVLSGLLPFLKEKWRAFAVGTLGIMPMQDIIARYHFVGCSDEDRLIASISDVVHNTAALPSELREWRATFISTILDKLTIIEKKSGKILNHLPSLLRDDEPQSAFENDQGAPAFAPSTLHEGYYDGPGETLHPLVAHGAGDHRDPRTAAAPSSEVQYKRMPPADQAPYRPNAASIAGPARKKPGRPGRHGISSQNTSEAQTQRGPALAEHTPLYQRNGADAGDARVSWNNPLTLLRHILYNGQAEMPGGADHGKAFTTLASVCAHTEAFFGGYMNACKEIENAVTSRFLAESEANLDSASLAIILRCTPLTVLEYKRLLDAMGVFRTHILVLQVPACKELIHGVCYSVHTCGQSHPAYDVSVSEPPQGDGQAPHSRDAKDARDGDGAQSTLYRRLLQKGFSPLETVFLDDCCHTDTEKPPAPDERPCTGSADGTLGANGAHNAHSAQCTPRTPEFFAARRAYLQTIARILSYLKATVGLHAARSSGHPPRDKLSIISPKVSGYLNLIERVVFTHLKFRVEALYLLGSHASASAGLSSTWEAACCQSMCYNLKFNYPYCFSADDYLCVYHTLVLSALVTEIRRHHPHVELCALSPLVVRRFNGLALEYYEPFVRANVVSIRDIVEACTLFNSHSEMFAPAALGAAGRAPARDGRDARQDAAPPSAAERAQGPLTLSTLYEHLVDIHNSIALSNLQFAYPYPQVSMQAFAQAPAGTHTAAAAAAEAGEHSAAHLAVLPGALPPAQSGGALGAEGGGGAPLTLFEARLHSLSIDQRMKYDAATERAECAGRTERTERARTSYRFVHPLRAWPSADRLHSCINRNGYGLLPNGSEGTVHFSRQINVTQLLEDNRKRIQSLEDVSAIEEELLTYDVYIYNLKLIENRLQIFCDSCCPHLYEVESRLGLSDGDLCQSTCFGSGSFLDTSSVILGDLVDSPQPPREPGGSGSGGEQPQPQPAQDGPLAPAPVPTSGPGPGPGMHADDVQRAVRMDRGISRHVALNLPKSSLEIIRNIIGPDYYEYLLSLPKVSAPFILKRLKEFLQQLIVHRNAVQAPIVQRQLRLWSTKSLDFMSFAQLDADKKAHTGRAVLADFDARRNASLAAAAAIEDSVDPTGCTRLADILYDVQHAAAARHEEPAAGGSGSGGSGGSGCSGCAGEGGAAYGGRSRGEGACGGAHTPAQEDAEASAGRQTSTETSLTEYDCGAHVLRDTRALLVLQDDLEQEIRIVRKDGRYAAYAAEFSSREGLVRSLLGRRPEPAPVLAPVLVPVLTLPPATAQAPACFDKSNILLDAGFSSDVTHWVSRVSRDPRSLNQSIRDSTSFDRVPQDRAVRSEKPSARIPEEPEEPGEPEEPEAAAVDGAPAPAPWTGDSAGADGAACDDHLDGSPDERATAIEQGITAALQASTEYQALFRAVDAVKDATPWSDEYRCDGIVDFIVTNMTLAHSNLRPYNAYTRDRAAPGSAQSQAGSPPARSRLSPRLATDDVAAILLWSRCGGCATLCHDEDSILSDRARPSESADSTGRDGRGARQAASRISDDDGPIARSDGADVLRQLLERLDAGITKPPAVLGHLKAQQGKHAAPRLVTDLDIAPHTCSSMHHSMFKVAHICEQALQFLRDHLCHGRQSRACDADATSSDTDEPSAAVSVPVSQTTAANGASVSPFMAPAEFDGLADADIFDYLTSQFRLPRQQQQRQQQQPLGDAPAPKLVDSHIYIFLKYLYVSCTRLTILYHLCACPESGSCAVNDILVSAGLAAPKRLQVSASYSSGDMEHMSTILNSPYATVIAPLIAEQATALPQRDTHSNLGVMRETASLGNLAGLLADESECGEQPGQPGQPEALPSHEELWGVVTRYFSDKTSQDAAERDLSSLLGSYAYIGFNLKAVLRLLKKQFGEICGAYRRVHKMLDAADGDRVEGDSALFAGFLLYAQNHRGLQCFAPHADASFRLANADALRGIAARRSLQLFVCEAVCGAHCFSELFDGV